MAKLGEKFRKWSKVGSAKRRAAQVAALCTRKKDGKRQVLLVTSRETRRWVIPKGWPMKGLPDHEAAAIEAWEEAGISETKSKRKPIGRFDYLKKLDDGSALPVEVSVFRLKVKDTKKTYPECHQRKRKWVSPKTAAAMVREPGLRKILRDLAKA